MDRIVEWCTAAQATWAWRVRPLLRHEPLPCRPLVVVAIATLLGAVLGPAVAGVWPAGSAGIATCVCWLTAAAACGAWAWLLRTDRATCAAVALLVAIGTTAAGWSIARERLFRSDDLAWGLSETPTPVAIEGVVVESPRQLTIPPSSAPGGLAIEPSTECVVSVTKVRRGASWKPASGRAAVIVVGEPPDGVSGTRVRIVGRGLRPGHALNPGEFDFRERAQARRCLSIVRCDSRACVRVLRPPSAWSPAAWLDRIRAAGAAALDRYVGDRSGLAAALLLGSREALPAEDSQEFLVTGTIHVLSISGLHVGILAIGLFRVLRTLAVVRSWALVSVAVCTGLYMVLVGAETPVVRATLLVWLSCLGAALGRRSPALTALAAAAIVVVVWHPPEVFRVGTQLSFLSTGVLVGAAVFGPSLAASEDPIERLIEGSRSPLERRLRRWGKQAAGVAMVGTAIWAVTAPIVAMTFHVVSPIGLVLNPLIAPLVPLAMAWGLLCLLAASVSTTLAGLCGAGCSATLAVIEWLVGWAAAVPCGHVWVVGPDAWWVFGAYAWCLAVLVALPRERLVRPATWAAAAAVWMGVGAIVAAAGFLARPAAAALEVTVAALGHGCGVVVRSPTGRVLVYDAGRLGAPAAARRGMSAILWSGGIGRIDTLVISHADTDHFNAVPGLLERFAVGEVVVSESFLASDAPAVRDLLQRLHERRIPVRRVAAGDELACDPLCRVRVLHQDAAAADDNGTSLVLAVDAAGRRVLLPGDLEGDALGRFVAGGPDACDMLLAPHHGSATSLPPDIARATRPDWVVVSGPGGSRWAEVKQAYTSAGGAGRLASVVKTSGPHPASAGAVTATLSAHGVTMRQFRDGHWHEIAPPVRPERPSRVASAMPPRPEARHSRRGT
ncbi:MAG: ComEC/Rec2 family competence protein [Planctomycetia bacterium]